MERLEFEDGRLTCPSGLMRIRGNHGAKRATHASGSPPRFQSRQKNQIRGEERRPPAIPKETMRLRTYDGEVREGAIS